jgi:hypothetical protein
LTHREKPVTKFAFTFLLYRYAALMFRRDVRQFPKSKEVELRHQRSADCTLDVVQTTSTVGVRGFVCMFMLCCVCFAVCSVGGLVGVDTQLLASDESWVD